MAGIMSQASRASMVEAKVIRRRAEEAWKDWKPAKGKKKGDIRRVRHSSRTPQPTIEKPTRVRASGNKKTLAQTCDSMRVLNTPKACRNPANLFTRK